MPFEFHELMSQHLAAAAYDPEEQQLVVRFQDGAEWLYPNVPQSTFDLLMNSGSPGSFMRSVIKPIHGLHATKLKGKTPHGL